MILIFAYACNRFFGSRDATRVRTRASGGGASGMGRGLECGGIGVPVRSWHTDRAAKPGAALQNAASARRLTEYPVSRLAAWVRDGADQPGRPSTHRDGDHGPLANQRDDEYLRARPPRDAA